MRADIAPQKRQGLSGWFLSYWYGEKPLFKAFWGIGICCVPVIAIFQSVFFTLPSLYTSLGMTMIFLLVVISMQIFWIGSVWRCAFNVKVATWGYLARIIAFFSLLQTARFISYIF